MVPPRPDRLKHRNWDRWSGLRRRLAAIRDLARPLGWSVAVWALVVGLPFVWLYPGERLARPVSLLLVFLAPLASLAVATSGQATTLLITGLGALVPALVACPELRSPRVTGAVQGLAVAALLVVFIASALDAERGRMRALIRPDGDWLLPGIGVLWLALAWFGPAPRTAGVAVAAGTWMAVHLLRLAPEVRVDGLWWLSRGATAGLVAIAWGWWS